MGRIVEIARDFGIDDSLPPYLSISLGTAETTLMDLTSAYGMLVNGGKQIEPTLIDRVQDRYGRTLFRHERRNCAGCNDPEDWDRTSMPVVFEHGEQVTSELAAYHVVSMLRGVVERGTAARRVGLVVARPVGGKTGTTQESKDAWFIGFSPDLVVGVYVGFDQPRSLGAKESGGKSASPIFAAFINGALADTRDPVPLPGWRSDFEHRPADRRDRRAYGCGRRPCDRRRRRAPRSRQRQPRLAPVGRQRVGQFLDVGQPVFGRRVIGQPIRRQHRQRRRRHLLTVEVSAAGDRREHRDLIARVDQRVWLGKDLVHRQRGAWRAAPAPGRAPAPDWAASRAAPRPSSGCREGPGVPRRGRSEPVPRRNITNGSSRFLAGPDDGRALPGFCHA